MRFYIEKWSDMNGEYFLLRLENTFIYLSAGLFPSETNRIVFPTEEAARQHCKERNLFILNETPFDMGIA